MKIDILTLFPSMFTGPFDESIIKRAKEKGLVDISLHNLRNWAIDHHGTVDDKPYGGGVGMVLRPEPIVAALKDITSGNKIVGVGFPDPKKGAKTAPLQNQNQSIILLSASGKLFTQQKATHLSRLSHLTLICGHYEGVDQRIADYYVNEELSIGDYVLTGGEIPAMVIVDSVVRLIPGVLSKDDATKFESFSQTEIRNLLEHPHYTRPEVFDGHQVPEVLRSGNHKEIEKWRAEESLKRTQTNRPNLLRA